MARIPDDELERLKAEVSLVRLVEAAGIELARHGKDMVGRCPFHDDKTPSLVVSPQKNLWHCLGACQAGGSVVDWVMRAEGVSFRHAVELLRDGQAGGGGVRPVVRSSVRKRKERWPPHRTMAYTTYSPYRKACRWRRAARHRPETNSLTS